MNMCRCLILALIAVTAGNALAATNGFLVPAFRGSANTRAGYWETFSVPVGAPGNAPDKAGATTSARLTQSDTNAFLTGSGNLYNLTGTSLFTLADETPFVLGTVVLQTRTLGTELDYVAVELLYANESGTHAVAPLPHVELNRGNQPGLGATVSMLWQWNLAGLGVTAYTIRFKAAGASTSFDSLTLDTADTFKPLFSQPFAIDSATPDIERWMYANNGTPCDRPAGSSFATFGDEAGVDTRHAQHLIGWDTVAFLPPGRGAARYLVQRCRVTLTINRGNLFAYDSTGDAFQTCLPTNHPAWQPDTDAGRPVELFGVGYRNGFASATYDQCAPFGSNATGRRNAFAAGWSTSGDLVDVSNNVGKTNAAYLPFAVAPFAIGQTTNVAPGQMVPAGARITFELNLGDPLVLGYVQSALDSGTLRFMVSSLHPSGGQFGAPNYPDFATRFNEVVVEPTRIEIEGTVIGEGDADGDGLPDDWELAALHSLSFNASADPDGDGASNAAEFHAGTDSLNATSVPRIAASHASGHTTLRLTHAASRRYVIEFTEDFQHWRPLANAPVFELGTDKVQWIDNNDGSARRFYRARVE